MKKRSIPVGILLFLSQRVIPGTTRSDAIVNTVAGVIGMIPEGLVLLTSVSFIVGVGRLAMKNALVQEMEAIESLARVNVLCLDKTGTITTGQLEVEETRPYGAKALFLTLADIALLLSANLGVMNLLPIPALDGGRLLFFFAEAVTGRHLDRRVEGAIHFAGLVLLMGLMIFLMMHDFMRLMSG